VAPKTARKAQPLALFYSPTPSVSQLMRSQRPGGLLGAAHPVWLPSAPASEDGLLQCPMPEMDQTELNHFNPMFRTLGQR